MARYIDADKAKQEFNIGFGGVSHAVIANQIIDNIPTADVAEVKHGEWKICEDESQICASKFVCSVCKESFCNSELTDKEMREMLKYCPNCGAKMDL